MPDFHQPILLPTLHHLADTRLEEREALLETASGKKPVALVIPALYAELDGKALPRMLQQLSRARYIRRVVISMNGMNAAQHRRALRFFKTRLDGIRHTVLWNDGPELNALHLAVDALTGCVHTHGKGSNVWMGIAHLLADGYKGVIACHDSDILNYDREMLWRLCLPVAVSRMGYVFAKSYYGRVSDRMYGRVTRLLVFPLLEALRELFGFTPLLNFLAQFRYPLSGEFAADAGFLSKLGLSSDWGVEIRMLCDLFRVAPSQRICQVDLGGNFEHKHQHIGVDAATRRENAKSGLMRMAREVTLALLARLWDELGFAAESDKLRRLPDAYRDSARILLKRYTHEAIFNGLQDATADELMLVVMFENMLREIVSDGGKTKPSAAWLPSWAELKSRAPGLAERIAQAGSD